MSKITYSSKATGELLPASEFNQIKTVVNANDDALIALQDDVDEVISLPSGGDTGQVLAKASDNDGDVEWVDQTGGSGTGLGILVSFNESIPLNKGNSYMTGNASAGPHVFIPNTATAEQTGACTLYYKADGSGAPDTSAWVDRNGGITNYDDTVDMINELLFYRARSINMIAVTPIGVETVTQLSTPTYSADAVSDEEIDLTSISYDPDSEAMTIEQATNSGFTTGLTEIYSGVPKSSHNATGLTASTHYYFRIKTTASGFTDSDYGYDDDVTDAAGLTALNTVTSFAAGTPTADGCPFTWADTNTSPNESSYLIQITTTADTAYASIVTTRTPAANATSAVAGTGLSPFTGYRARIKAVGNGTTTADSAWSSEVTFTTAAATLNAPTSFAAGTPTADGCPFTWVDANTTPAESSYLIQITTAADTSYASVVTTRTPAANATSAAAGTGLTGSTNYRARIKAVGNGTSTLDSSYSSDVTFTTAAASVTLNAPTSFAAGTPAPTGVPSTWTDTNTSPAESSYLIQIAAAADTTYTTVIDTRTPAANATSDAGGTGLTPSTAYRMRIKAVGNGTTTLDSAYSSDVTFTTDSAAAGISDNFNRANSTSSIGGTWDAPGLGTWGIDTNRGYCVSETNSGAVTFPNVMQDSLLSDISLTSDIVFGANTAGGVIFRGVDSNNFLFLQVNTITGDWDLYKRVSGTFTVLHSESAVTATGATSTQVGIKTLGSSIEVYHNGVFLAGITDSTHLTATKCGMLVISGSGFGGGAKFDTLDVVTWP